MTGAPGAAAAIAIVRARQLQEEEEELGHAAGYGPEWEFKIVRSIRARFDRPHELKQVLAEEAAAGWRLVEKLDGQRIRLARPIKRRQTDANLSIDPYRTSIGIGPLKLVLFILAGTVLLLGLFVALMLALGQ